MSTTDAVLGYSVAGACSAVPCGRTKLYELIVTGRLDARKIGKKLVITGDSLRAYHASLPKADIRLPAAIRRAAERTAATTN